MHADRFGEVAVAVGIAGDFAAQPRQGGKGVPVVGLFQRFPDFGELQHQHAAAGAQHARHFGQCGFFVRHVAQTEGDADTVKVIVGEWQVLGVALHRRGDYAIVDHAVAADGEHAAVDVGEPDLPGGAGAPGKGARQVARTAGHIEHAAAFAYAALRHGLRLP